MKKLDNKIDKIEILEKNFQSEIDCLKNVKHENIVRFLGYCAETEPVVTWYPNEGRKVQAEVWHRLFCLEYVSKGNLSEYISGKINHKRAIFTYFIHPKINLC